MLLQGGVMFCLVQECIMKFDGGRQIRQYHSVQH